VRSWVATDLSPMALRDPAPTARGCTLSAMRCPPWRAHLATFSFTPCDEQRAPLRFFSRRFCRAAALLDLAVLIASGLSMAAACECDRGPGSSVLESALSIF